MVKKQKRVVALVVAITAISMGIVVHSEVEKGKQRIEATKLAEEHYFVNDKVLDTIVDDTVFYANRDGLVSEAGTLSSGIEVNVKSEAEQEANRILEEQRIAEEKRLEEERRQKEAEEAAKQEALKARAAATTASEVPDMTFEQTGDAVLTYNVYQKSNLTVDQFNQMLKGTALAGCGQSYYNMENTYNVNGVFAVALACHESGNGYHTANTHNYYGMKSGSGGWKSFSSADANIMYFGQYINSNMYKGKSIEGIGAIYCPGTSSSWASQVKTHMKEKWNKITF